MPEEKQAIPNLEPAKLAELITDVVEQRVFTSSQVPGDLLPVVFMPLVLGALDTIDVESIGMLYEYYDKAGPRSVNGYPMFMSVRFLSMHDSKILIEKANAILERRKSEKDELASELKGQE